MRNYSNNEIINYLDQYNYDIRVSRDARWIDQKCTIDVLSIVADCIINYIEEDKEKEFTVKDIWYSNYATRNVQEIFSKPNPAEKASNEYDKYFGQPIKLLNYAGILSSHKQGVKFIYKVKEIELLEYLSFRERNCLNFLQLYIEKVLRDSKIYYLFETFFQNPVKSTFLDLKEGFKNFTIQYTNINGKTECGRIFSKVLNPLSFKHNTYGTKDGRISKDIIEYNSLLYNQKNFRDIAVEKPKGITRLEYAQMIERETQTASWLQYQVNKAKNWLKKYNNQFRNGKSEVDNDIEEATQIHHIFPNNQYPEISALLENLIALTPNQHYIYAHPNNNTNEIDRNYQYTCIINKINNIKENIENSKLPTIYAFNNLRVVLNIGLETNRFDQIEDMDFQGIINLVEELYN